MGEKSYTSELASELAMLAPDEAQSRYGWSGSKQEIQSLGNFWVLERQRGDCPLRQYCRQNSILSARGQTFL